MGKIVGFFEKIPRVSWVVDILQIFPHESQIDDPNGFKAAHSTTNFYLHNFFESEQPFFESGPIISFVAIRVDAARPRVETPSAQQLRRVTPPPISRALCAECGCMALFCRQGEGAA
jgi:hypothetical protein